VVQSLQRVPAKLLINIKNKLPGHSHNDGVPCSNQGVTTIFLHDSDVAFLTRDFERLLDMWIDQAMFTLSNSKSTRTVANGLFTGGDGKWVLAPERHLLQC